MEAVTYRWVHREHEEPVDYYFYGYLHPHMGIFEIQICLKRLLSQIYRLAYIACWGLAKTRALQVHDVWFLMVRHNVHNEAFLRSNQCHKPGTIIMYPNAIFSSSDKHWRLGIRLRHYILYVSYQTSRYLPQKITTCPHVWAKYILRDSSMKSCWWLEI